MSKITKATLKKAQRLYPVGTKFISLFGVDDVVTQKYDIYINLTKK